jgi:hypothetical protein
MGRKFVRSGKIMPAGMGESEVLQNDPMRRD